MNTLQWAWEQEIPSTPKFVLVALADFAGSKLDHTCWPSIETIARKCGLKMRAVQYAIKKLISWKLLRRIGIHACGTPLYQLLVRKRGASGAGGAAHAPGVQQVRQRGAFNAKTPVHQMHPNNAVPKPSIEEEEDAAPPVVETVRIGHLVFTSHEHQHLKAHFGAGLAAILEDMNRHERPIRHPYRAALAWSIAPAQPEIEHTITPRRDYGRKLSAEQRQDRTFENIDRAASAVAAGLGIDLSNGSDERDRADLHRRPDGHSPGSARDGRPSRSQRVALLPVGG